MVMSILCMCHPAVSELCLAIWAVNTTTTTTTGIFCCSFLLPSTSLQALALCLSWQQCEVNRMNKTYLNQSPLPWEMSTCQCSLMGKHRASPKGQTVYWSAPMKMHPGQLVSLFITNTKLVTFLSQKYHKSIPLRKSAFTVETMFFRIFQSVNMLL